MLVSFPIRQICQINKYFFGLGDCHIGKLSVESCYFGPIYMVIILHNGSYLFSYAMAGLSYFFVYRAPPGWSLSTDQKTGQELRAHVFFTPSELKNEFWLSGFIFEQKEHRNKHIQIKTASDRNLR